MMILRATLTVALLLAGCEGSLVGGLPGPDLGSADLSDQGSRDADGTDVGPSDLGPADAGSPDAGLRDAGLRDAGTATDLGAALGCADGRQNGDETDVDCGGSCAPCVNGGGCALGADCASGLCALAECAARGDVHEDIDRIVDVPGRNPRNNWSDSYSADGRCYCDTTFDHAIGGIVVDTPVGPRTVREVCDALGPGPGADPPGGDPRPVYNDVQCGNGPPNNAGDEDDCPGRVDLGRDGCGHIGPTWDLSAL